MQDRNHSDCPREGNAPTDWYSTAQNEVTAHKISPTYTTRPAEHTHTHQPPPSSVGSPPQYRSYGAAYYPYVTEPKNRSTGKTVAIAILSLILVIMAAALVINISEGVTAGQSAANPPSITTASPSGMPSLEEYFAQDSGSTAIAIPKASTGTGVTVKLSPRHDAAELTLQDVYRKCSASVVAITTDIGGKYGSTSWGTGIVLTSDGYIITNTHVLEGGNSATVTLEDNSTFEAKLVGYDTASDIAVLKIDATGLIPAEFGDSSELEVGDEVVAIGNPLGEEFRGTMTNGIISAIDRDISYQGYTMTLLQTNTAINEGNSGGPLINMQGQVIGITNMKMSSYYYESTIEGIGFAIPTSGMKSVVDQLIEQGFVFGRPMFGFTIGSMPDEHLANSDYPDGLYVAEVDERSDAYEKGIRKGDIITAVNDIPVTTTAEVSAIKNEYEVGDELIVTVYRRGEIFDLGILLIDASQLS